MPNRRPIGVVDIVFAPDGPVEAASRAADLGFDHIDLTTEWDAPLALPVGDRCTERPVAGCTVGALPDAPGAWERSVRAYRRCSTVRLEPWTGSVVSSNDRVRAMLDEVPGLRLCVDTGHVACWGGDPLELLPFADSVQLRQARRGVAQCAPEDGDVDFRAVLDQLDALEFTGPVSIEYFDLPDYGWPLDDPVGHAVALGRYVRALMS
jgi:hypothetical protein